MEAECWSGVQVWALVHTGGADVNLRDPSTGCWPAGLAAGVAPPAAGGTLLLATLHAASLLRRTTLHAAGLDVNAPLDVNGCDAGGVAPLEAVLCTWAESEAMVEWVRLALDVGADMRAVFTAGQTALHVAARRGLTDVVAEFVARGADPNVRDHAGRRCVPLPVFLCSSLSLSHRLEESTLPLPLSLRSTERARVDLVGLTREVETPLPSNHPRMRPADAIPVEYHAIQCYGRLD
jgi:hypothetical protein